MCKSNTMKLVLVRGILIYRLFAIHLRKYPIVLLRILPPPHDIAVNIPSMLFAFLTMKFSVSKILKYITMGACIYKKQYQLLIILLPNQQPIRSDMTLQTSFIISF